MGIFKIIEFKMKNFDSVTFPPLLIKALGGGLQGYKRIVHFCDFWSLLKGEFMLDGTIL